MVSPGDFTIEVNGIPNFKTFDIIESNLSFVQKISSKIMDINKNNNDASILR